ncbi:MAG: hypothetical protein ABL984_00440 [Pyrinomonadaceae bacterium]
MRRALGIKPIPTNIRLSLDEAGIVSEAEWDEIRRRVRENKAHRGIEGNSLRDLHTIHRARGSTGSTNGPNGVSWAEYKRQGGT